MGRGVILLFHSRTRSFGVVYAALDKKRRFMVAMKKMSSLIDLSLIQKEVNLLQSCSSPYVVRYYDALKDDNAFWVVAYAPD